MAGSIWAGEKELITVLSEWWIPVAVMLSLLMQLLLLLTGGTRKWNRICRFLAWNAYNWSDYVAATALGGMAQAAVADDIDPHKKEVYALWAPILLLHLGAPDNISAYATADAELWMRHGLTMALQVVIVVYVVANCARTWNFVLLGIVLAALGAIKYAERTFALKRASYGDITESALPIYVYMEVEGNPPTRDIQQAAKQGKPLYKFIITGEKQWLARSSQQPRTGEKMTPQLVTLEDVLSCRTLVREVPALVSLCVGFALFKLYKRRLCNLFMHEWLHPNIRGFFLEEHVFMEGEKDEKMDKLMYVLDAELRFVFDSIYTKAAGTAYSKAGASFRILTTILLVISAVFVLGGKLHLDGQAIHQARDVTFCLIAAALLIEGYQVCRLVLSDWCRVWLVCKYILWCEKHELQRRSESKNDPPNNRAFGLPTLMLRVMKLQNKLVRHKYWSSRLGQYALIPTSEHDKSLQRMRLKYKPLQVLIPPKYEESTKVVHEFKRWVLWRVLQACRRVVAQGGQGDFKALVGHCALVRTDWFMGWYKAQLGKYLQNYTEDNIVDDFAYNFEHFVTHLHVATHQFTLLEQQRLNDERELNHEIKHAPSTNSAGNINNASNGPAAAAYDQQPNQITIHLGAPATTSSTTTNKYLHEDETELQDNMRMSMLLSRYMMYLMVHKTELLPCHVHIARGVAADTEKRFLRPMTQHSDGFTMYNNPLTPDLENLSSAGERWQLISNLWVNIFIGAAAHAKVGEHLRQLTLGGEFLTLVWVLLGHMGFGGQ